MLKTKDEEINKILDRAETYRKQFENTNLNKQQIIDNMNTNIENIFNEFFKENKNQNCNDKNNVFINYKLTQDELNNGCKKT